MTIQEYKYGHHKFYVVKIKKTEEETTFIVKVRCETVLHDENTYYVIYDSQMVPIYEAFCFINIHKYDSSLAARNKIGAILKTVYAFKEIYQLGGLEAFCKIDVLDRFRAFLSGRVLPQSEMHGCSTRLTDTVNQYLGVLNAYLLYLGIESNVLNSFVKIGGGSEVVRRRYGERAYHRCADIVPFDMTEDDVHKLCNWFLDNKYLTHLVVTTIQADAGMRIGETLGLTIEDIGWDIGKNGEPYYYIKIRNRVSDERVLQNSGTAKNKYHPLSSADYLLPSYKYNVEERAILKVNYELLCAYIENVHQEAALKYPDKYVGNIADSIDAPSFINRYIFLNSCGGVMKYSAYNKIFKRAMKECGIHVDLGKRMTNTTHRLRHYFTKRIMQYTTPTELQHLLGHASIESQNSYSKLTAEEQAALKERYIKSYYQEFPEFEPKLGMKDDE